MQWGFHSNAQRIPLHRNRGPDPSERGWTRDSGPATVGGAGALRLSFETPVLSPTSTDSVRPGSSAAAGDPAETPHLEQLGAEPVCHQTPDAVRLTDGGRGLGLGGGGVGSGDDRRVDAVE
jgi:hypothetical protein